MADLSPEAVKLLAARKAAIAELREIDGKDRPIHDHDVMRVSGARMLVEGLTLRMLAGEAVGSAEFKAATEMVEAALADAGKRLMEVRVSYVEGVKGVFTCVHCQKRNELDAGTYVPAGRGHYEISGPGDAGGTPRGLEPNPVAPVIDATANKPVGASEAPPKANPTPKATPSPANSPPHIVKDTRPNAPANGSAGLCWFGTSGGGYPLDRSR